jgi:hypothetical protein
MPNNKRNANVNVPQWATDPFLKWLWTQPPEVTVQAMVHGFTADWKQMHSITEDKNPKAEFGFSCFLCSSQLHSAQNVDRGELVAVDVCELCLGLVGGLGCLLGPHEHLRHVQQSHDAYLQGGMGTRV